MQILTSPNLLQNKLSRIKRRGKSVGFVPTMGAIHEGHLALIRRAKRENDIVVVSVFVNPTQFGPREDFKKYPRPQSKDQRLLQKAKVDFVFRPTVSGIYPKGFKNYVEVTKSLTRVLCGRFRPRHFRGVTTVVARLFQIVKPKRAYFGQKDFQQSVVIRRMVRDLKLPVQIKVLPIVRESNGLALSSRNQYLSDSARKRAMEIYATLKWMRRELRLKPKASIQKIRREARKRLGDRAGRVQYLEIVDPENLKSLKRRQRKMALVCACFVGKTRLIDNVILRSREA